MTGASVSWHLHRYRFGHPSCHLSPLKTIRSSDEPQARQKFHITPRGSGHRPHVLLIVETAMSFGRGVLEGISQYLFENPPWSVQLDLRELMVTPPAWLQQWDGDGIITRSTTPELADFISQSGIPTVNLTDIYGDQGLPSIWNDHEAIGRMAAEHLLQRGLKRFAFCGFTNHQWSETRYRGFMDHLGPASEVLFHSSDWAQARRTGWETQQARMVQWLLDLPSQSE